MVSEFLSQLDGMDDNNGVVVVGSTNIIKKIDDAFLERFATIIKVPLPHYDARRQMFSDFLDGVPLILDVNYSALADTSDGYSGRKIENLCREVIKIHYKKVAKKEVEVESITVKTSDFYNKTVNEEVNKTEKNLKEKKIIDLDKILEVVECDTGEDKETEITSTDGTEDTEEEISDTSDTNDSD